MHTLFRPFAIGTLMLSVAAYQTTTQAQETSSTAAASGDVTVADFAGEWGGEWSRGGAWSTLTVTDVEPLEIRYCYADSCGAGSKELDNVRFEKGELRFKWGKGRFRFGLDDETLKGTYTNSRGETYTVKMTRKSTAEMTRKSTTQTNSAMIADFAGKWTGRWSGGGARSTLTITDAEPLKVKYCFRGDCSSMGPDRVRFEEGELRFGNFRFSLNGEVLEGTLDRHGQTYRTKMLRK